MAGIWDRIVAGADNNLSVELLADVFTAHAVRLLSTSGTPGLTAAAVLTTLNDSLSESNSPVLDTASESDLSAIAGQIVSPPFGLSSGLYIAMVRAYASQAEKGRITESKFRADLNI